jgi:hypothetical protein
VDTNDFFGGKIFKTKLKKRKMKNGLEIVQNIIKRCFLVLGLKPITLPPRHISFTFSLFSPSTLPSRDRCHHATHAYAGEQCCAGPNATAAAGQATTTTTARGERESI